ncbi:uncharacterized protein [Trachinotus anak]|uniref:uncharacterized protein isoform X2 n=1 Tax=Trachinotus anak TaxID=443729 RepID=UPI0039F23223
MKLIPDFTYCLLQLLLLAELFLHSSSRPTHGSSLCGVLGSIIHQVDRLVNISKKLHELSGDELLDVAAVANRLPGLPNMQHTAAHLSSLKVNESLSQLYVYAQSFKLHTDWLKTEKDNFSLPSQSAEGASTHLLRLSNLIVMSLHQMSEEVPQPTPPCLPVASTTFDVLQFSVEISERLQTFCDWSKRVLRLLKTQSRCPRH